jgi:4-alpha-glucanotransferase
MTTSANNHIHFILALHNHQPEGNLPEVFGRTFAAAYDPFLRELERFPRIKVVQHYSGILLRWLQENRPEFVSRLRNLVSSGQIEMMGGAFFEPILAMIPDEDKVGQIEMQSRFLQENFQSETVGAWLAERVWEPHLARPLAQAGIRYTVLDDAHFRNVGFSEEATLHYYLTEEEGAPLHIFPISEKLRYLIPFADPQETIDYLREMATPAGERVVVLADDGEKFGSWPGTSEHVYGKQWLSRFFQLLDDNRHWLHVTTFAGFMAKQPPAGKVYLPAGSYREMMEWSGGFWRNFFVRYPESNHIHKKMLHVRERVQKLPEGPQKKEAQEYLWAGQCNCAYWHGVFGGLYLNFLRSALYSRLIAAETLADRALHSPGPWLEMEQKDFDYDGHEEVLVSGPELGFTLSPSHGGALLEMNFKPRRFNLLDVLTRRPEPYHCNIFEMARGACDNDELKTIHHITRVKEAGLEEFLVYDSYRRASLIDHVYPADISAGDMMAGPGHADTGDFIAAPYRLEQTDANGHARISMEREGQVRQNGVSRPLHIRKTVDYQPGSGEIRYEYTLLNTGDQLLEAVFAVEFNITFLAGNAPDRYFTLAGHPLPERNLSSRGELKQVRRFGLVDEWQQIVTEFSFAQPATVWRMPIETVSQSEDGMERVYQGSTVMPAWPVALRPGEPHTLQFAQKTREQIREVH